MKVRYLEHYHDEWLVGVAGLTPEQNGIYRTICDLIASSGGPIPIDDERLFRIVKAKRNRIKRVISELVAVNKCAVIGSQLVNNRVISELERAQKRSRAGSELAGKRWHSNGLAHADGNGTRAKPEPEPEPDKEIETRASPRAALAGWEEWWAEYPDKVGKGNAKPAYRRALTKTSADVLLAALRRYKANKPEWKAWCGPAVWLNQERWNDVPAANGSAEISEQRTPTGPPPEVEDSLFREFGINRD